MPGAWCARSRAWWVVNTRVNHHGHTGNTRHSPRNGFNGFLRALLGDRALLSPSSSGYRRVGPEGPTSPPAKLDASVGASGPHDFAVRKPAPSSEAQFASIASHPASVTIAIRPSSGVVRDGYESDLGKQRTGIFFQKRLDSNPKSPPATNDLFAPKQTGDLGPAPGSCDCRGAVQPLMSAARPRWPAVMFRRPSTSAS
jgi:hypothetical protein